MALWNQGVKEKYLTLVEWEIPTTSRKLQLCNCAIYRVATAWKRKDQRNSNDNRHTSHDSQSDLKHHRKLKDVKKIEENMQLCRRELSQLTAEIERIRSLLRKTKRNR